MLPSAADLRLRKSTSWKTPEQMRIRQAVEAAGDATSLTGRRSHFAQPSADGAPQSLEQVQCVVIALEFLV